MINTRNWVMMTMMEIMTMKKTTMKVTKMKMKMEMTKIHMMMGGWKLERKTVQKLYPPTKMRGDLIGGLRSCNNCTESNKSF